MDKSSALEYINQMFPNEASLSGVEPLMQKIQNEIRTVDAGILAAVRQQSNSGTKAKEDLAAATRAVEELMYKIREIKTKAVQSETMVQEICRDIKKLDFAKKHITTTITALHRLTMLVSAVEQLQVMASKRQYKEAAAQLKVIDRFSPQKKMLTRAVARQLPSNSSSHFHSLSDHHHHLLHQPISELNSLITSYIRRGNPISAFNLFLSLRRKHSDIDAHTFTPLLRPSPPSLGKQFHAQMIRTGADSGTVSKTALLDMYSRHGSLKDSLKVFDEMLHRDVVAWNALLSCFLRCGKASEVVGVLREMGRENVDLSEFTLCSVLKCCALLKSLELGRQVHGLVVCLGRDLVVLSTALIDFYCSVGCVDDGLKVFYGLKGWKDDMMHNSLVSGCIRNGRYEEAFKVMSLVKPNVVALTCVISCCSEKLDLLTGKQVHCVAVRRGFTFETQLCNVLLDMYAKCGKILLARSVFDGICRKDVISWTCMIDAYGRNGFGREAIKLFHKMREDISEVLPNSVTFLSVLSACGHSGLVEEGKQCFNMLREKYGIDPEPEHYACFIDILGRAGKIDEVWSVYQNMIEQGTRPTAGVWIALLNACSLSQDFERGEFAAKHVLQLKPDKASNFVLVSNFYAAIGRWDCVDELRSIMRSKGLVKEAGNSWIGEGFNGHARSLSA